MFEFRLLYTAPYWTITCRDPQITTVGDTIEEAFDAVGEAMLMAHSDFPSELMRTMQAAEAMTPEEQGDWLVPDDWTAAPPVPESE